MADESKVVRVENCWGKIKETKMNGKHKEPKGETSGKHVYITRVMYNYWYVYVIQKYQNACLRSHNWILVVIECQKAYLRTHNWTLVVVKMPESLFTDSQLDFRSAEVPVCLFTDSQLNFSSNKGARKPIYGLTTGLE